MALPECCEAAKARLIAGEIEASKAHVKALREHDAGKHASPAPAPATALKK